ncbi:flagellin [Clostridium punense]|uniref:Flagellin n=1 Tax=Clostridium punense TaxID=1054297 RepID=A0ABS4K3X7_9CLOT|nr:MULTISPECIES: flagellin [Clostridium]EQB88550.1 hypothetical protein M918_03910 [Clostridium sp. BL8]MBP2021826.1 flagellin [Clostridium punense]
MVINHNLRAMQAHRSGKEKNVNIGKSAEKLSSGLRISRASDDAAGLSISEKMRGQIRGLGQASKNAQDAISLTDVAEGALNEIQASLHRLRELEVQRCNDTNVTIDREAIEKEMSEILSNINQIAEVTSFNGMNLLNGSLPEVTVQVGADENQFMKIKFSADKDFTIPFGLDLPESSMLAPYGTPGINKLDIPRVDKALEKVSSQRGDLGAVRNALEHAINNLNNGQENTQAAESRIRDVDMAKEMMILSKENILMQSSQAMLSQANQAPQRILDLLK